ncbi:internal scaffolding protein VP3 [Gokushovirinae Fen672_31]|uniref:internal scaffolding protein VP3 n=1 Tax=Gokushovirinae Fen672_31 TaxID=1655656 RepID=UPI00063D5D03|nr:internal scaffolding protein VP3 [Gokushovirinae Fen672_31]AKI26921.1 internal scaffolding protein VP3 [Gokushovirinae Fen672_31]
MASDKRGVHRIESEVFHYEKPKENGLSDFYKPHIAVGSPAGGPTLTRQEFAEECDVNAIMERYETTGVLPNVVGQPFYYDFTTLPTDMMSAMDVMRNATDAFYTLPAKVRKEFDNDAAAFVDFASDPDNLDQMRSWGLAPQAKPEEPLVAPQAAPGPALAPAAPGPAAAPGGASKPA